MDHWTSKLKASFLAVVWGAIWFGCFLRGMAQAAEQPSPQASSPTADMTVATFKMLASLGLIIGVIIVVFYLLKRLRGLSGVTQGGPSMRIVSSLAVAPKRSVTVVEVGEKWLILGVGADTISLLSTMEPIPDVPGKNHSTTSQGSSFQRILQSKKLLFTQALRGERKQ